MSKFKLLLLLLILVTITKVTLSQAPSARVTFTTLAQMMAYSGNYTECFLDDAAQGGFFNMKTKPSVMDSGINFPTGIVNKAWVRNMSQNKGIYLSWFGPKGDGVTNDYLRLKAFSNYVTANAKSLGIQDVYFGRDKVYYVNKQYAGDQLNDFQFEHLNGVALWGGNCKVVTDGRFTKGSDLQRQVRFTFDSCTSLRVNDLIIDQQNQYTDKNGTSESTGHCFSISSCENVTLQNCTALNAQVDGFYITEGANGDPRRESRNIMLINCKSFLAGRQGISVVQCVNFTALNCEFKYTGQHLNARYAPGSGCDVEPNRSTGSTPATRENTSRILFKNCIFAGNYNSQFVCGGTPTQYNTITIEGCTFRDVDGGTYNDTIYSKSGTYDYSIDIGGNNVRFLNNVCTLNAGFFSVGYSRTPTELAGTAVRIEGNRFSFAGGDKQWMRVSDGCSEVKIINNNFSGTSACLPFQGGTACVVIDNASLPIQTFVWENNYMFIPKEKFRIGLASDYLQFVDLNRCTVRNSTFETDLTTNYLGATTAHYNVVLSGGIVENVKLKGTNPGFSDVIRATNSTATYNNVDFNTNYYLSNKGIMTDSLIFMTSITNRSNTMRYGTAPPTKGNYIKGDITFNSNASVGQPGGWICTTASVGANGGTWSALSSVAVVQNRVSPVASAAMASMGTALVIIGLAWLYKRKKKGVVEMEKEIIL